MSNRGWLAGCLAVTSWLVVVGGGCSSASGDKNVFEGNGGGSGGAGSGGTGGLLNVGGGGSGEGGILNTTPPCNAGDPNADSDGDGWSPADGDCNDCTAQMNPGAYDYPGNLVDEDCNGVPDDEPTGCDQGLPMDANDPMSAAKAMGLCKVAQPNAWPQRTWGVLSARYVFADGSTQSGPPDNFMGSCTGPGGQGSPPNPMSHGALPRFGPAVAPREGAALVALSSGVAREGVNGDSPGGALMCTQSATPWGFPTPSTAACPGQPIDDTPIANDPMALELVIRAPTNVKSFSFDFDFYTYEYPDWICSEYNDFFVALLFSGHPDVPPNKNISFDSKGNPVSVNNGFLEVCAPGTHNGKTFPCSLGTQELNGTGFESHAATGWLQTKTPVLPGEEFTLRFAIWDMGDEILDSTVLIDNFKWDVNEGQTQTDRPPPK
jgi:hypothetical protein